MIISCLIGFLASHQPLEQLNTKVIRILEKSFDGSICNQSVTPCVIKMYPKNLRMKCLLLSISQKRLVRFRSVEFKS